MADKKLNNVSTLTSSTLASNDYAYVEDVSASNEQKKVLISDLAKVVGVQINQGESAYDDANNVGGAFEMARVRGSNIPSSQIVAVIINFWMNNSGSVRRQIALNNSGVYTRHRNDQGVWGEWQQLNIV